MAVEVTRDELQQFMLLCEKLENFVRFVLKAEPTSQQMEIINAIDGGARRIAVKSGHGTGKSSLLSWISLWVGLTKYDAKIPITAPSAPQLLFTLMPEIRKWEQNLPSVMRKSIDVKTDTISFKNGNFIAMRTARKENPEALQGFHATNLFFLVDEGSGVPDNIFEVVEGALTGERNVIVMVGNPTRTSGYFYNAFHKNSELWDTYTLNAEESPNVDPKVIELRKKQYGVDSDVYRVRVLGEFPRASNDALFRVDEMADALVREDYCSDGEEIWGLDVAELGADKCVIAKRKGFFFRPLEEIGKVEVEDCVNWVVSSYSRAAIKPAAIYVDNIGYGAAVFSMLLNRGLPVVAGDVRRTSFELGLDKKRIEMYQRLSANMKNIRLPDDDDLVGELSAIRYKISNAGLISLESKDETRKRLGRSPDKADAVALTFYEERYFDDELEDEPGEDERMAMANRRNTTSSELGCWGQ